MEKVSQAVFERLLQMEDEELKALSNDELDGVISIMDRLCKLMDGQHHKPLEKFKLALANKCLQSTNLAKRLYGLNTINKLIEMANRKEMEDRHRNMGFDMRYVLCLSLR